MADYRYIESGQVIRSVDGALMQSADTANYTAYQTWVAGGGVPDPYIPQTVSAMQAKVALSRAGLLTSVQTWMNSQSAETQLIWNSATSFDRGSALIANAGAALGLSSPQIDGLFVTAASINP